MSYDTWLQRPYMIDTPHYKECPLHEDRDFADDDECVCVELDTDAKVNAEEMAFELSRE